MIEIGYVPNQIADQIESLVLHNINFPWYLAPETTGYDLDHPDALPTDVSGEDPQFEHLVIGNNGMYSPEVYNDICKPIIDSIGVDKKVKRVKLNLLSNRPSLHLYHTPHVDYDQPHLTAIYYVNDNDGPTYFFNEMYDGTFQKLTQKEISLPKKGKFVLFDGLRYHASSNPITKPIRCIMNINFYAE